MNIHNVADRAPPYPLAGPELPSDAGGEALVADSPSERPDLLSQLEAGWRLHGDAFEITLNGIHCVAVAHPRHVQRVLTDSNYTNKGPLYEGVRKVLGDGILTSSGDKWRGRRQIITPGFHHEYISRMIDTMADTGSTFVDNLRERAGNGTTIDLQEEMTALTLQTLTAVLQDMVTNSRQAEPDGTLLSMLAHATDETGNYLDDAALKEELLTIIFAGHETTALTLTWFFKLLQEHPDIAQRVTNEVRTTLAGRAPCAEDITTLTYMRQVLDEVLRLRPPVPFIARAAQEEDVLGNHKLMAGDAVLPFIYGMHRHPDFWNQPEQFDPDRFLPDNARGRDRWAYLPFAGGNRLCIGKGLALAELSIHAALLLKNFDWHVAPGNVQPYASMTLRPASPIHAQIQPVNL